MDAGTFAGDIYYEIGMEIMPESELVGRIMLKEAWGYYRSAENLEGMKKCADYLKGDLSPEAKAISIEHNRDRLRAFSEAMQDDLGQRLLSDPAGIELFKIRIKPQVKESAEKLIKFFESKEFRGF